MSALGAQYVYGIVPAGTAVPQGLRGLGDAEVRVLDHDGVAVALGEVDDDRPLGRRDLLAHSRVVDTLAEVGPILPARFGSVLPAETDPIEELLVPNADHLSELLADLTGMVQLNLSARYIEDVVLAEIVTADPQIEALSEETRGVPEDAAYDERIRLGEMVSHALEEVRADDTEVILSALAPLAADHRARPGGGIDQVVDLSFLVPDEQRERFEEAAERLAAALHERMRLRLVGPVAPYDFVPEE